MPVRVFGTVERYLIAVIAVAAGIGVKYALGGVADQEQAPFLLMAAVVIVAGWYGGFGPGMAATVLTTIGVRWLFMEPRYSLGMTSGGVGLNLVIHMIEGLIISALCEGRLRARRQSERVTAELEERVNERTGALSQANTTLAGEVVERRRIERDLYRQREYLRALLAALEEGIVAADESGRVVLVNRAAVEMYGLPDPETPYEDWDQYRRAFYPDGKTPVPLEELPLWRAMREEDLVEVEYIIEGNDLRRRYLESTARAIRGQNGERLGAVVVFRDVTEKRRLEEERKRFVSQLERSNRELQDFASVASHDLQEPLRKIQAFGDRLRVKYQAQLGTEGKDYLARMLNAAERMSTLISDLLTFSRVTTRAQPFRRVDLNRTVRDVVSDLETRIEQSGGRVEVGEMPTVEADDLQLRQLFQNLIGNALKFHRPEESPVVRVEGRIEGHAGDEEVCRLTVSDNGIGFDEKYLDRIFNVFQRLHGRGQYEGTGIGLAVCRKIAERHHGSITARSVPGRGSAFTVTLPVRQPEHEQSK